MTVTINVTNQRPWSVNRSYAVLHDHSLTVDAPGLFAFSGDGDSDVLTIVAGVAPTHGAVTINADGSFTYIPAAGYVGTDSFGYRVSDGVSQSDVSLVSIQVFNSAPLATTDYYTGSHDRPMTRDALHGVLANDRDLNDDPLTVTVVAGHDVQHGTLVLNANGSLTYTPNAGFVGTDTFRYRVTDGAQTADADVTLTIINQRPVAGNDKYGATVEQTLNVNAATGVLFNDSDADPDVLQAILVTGTSHGTLTLNSDGSFSYTPDAGFIGVDEFRYQAKDPLNLTSFIAKASISTALVATNDQYTVSHDRVLTGNVESNDFTVSGSPPTYVLLSGPASGTLTFNADGTFSYTPVAGYVGQQTFTYEFQANGHTSNMATATIDIVNEAPLVFTGTWRASHGQSITASSADGLAFRSRDRDGDAMTYSVVIQPAHGTLTLQSDGSFIYVPTDSAYTGPDSFMWQAFDGLLYSEVKTAWIELLNHKTTVIADSYQIHSGQTLTVTVANGVLSNDYDSDDDTLQAEITAQPTHGVVTLAADGSFVYTPNAATINETDTFSYRVFDGAEYSDVGEVSIRISNALPQVQPEQYSLQHDHLLNVSVDRGLLANDYDGDSDPIIAVIDAFPQHGTVTLAADGSFTFQPTAGFVGTDSFTYRVSDGIQQSDPVTVSLTVTNKSPVANSDQFITRRNTSLIITTAEITGNDSDSDGDTLSLLPLGTPGHGTLTASGTGEWAYHPNAGFVGTDTISYQVSDGVTSSVATLIQIDVLNSAPVAAGDRFEVRHDLAFIVAAGKIQTNDFDLEGDALTVSVVDNVRNGTLTMQTSGAFTYTPNAGFTGRDTFGYRLYDGNLYSDPVRVILDVINHRPTARDGSQRITHDTVLTQPASSGLLAGARDVDGDALTASIVSNVHNGTLVVQADGSWTYSPATHFVGTDSFTYRVSDGALQSLTKTITIEVSNTPVVASMDAYTVTPNTPLNVAAPGVLQNDSDIDGDTLTLTVVDNVLHGTLSLQQDGSFVYTPAAGYIGQDSFTYKVSDGLEETTATVQLTVTGIPQTTQTVPVARNDFYSTPHATLLTVSAAAGLLGNDRDPNNDPLTVQLVAGPAHGTLTLNANGSFSYTPTGSFVGTDSFTYRSSDGTNLSAVTTAEIKVRNTLPWAANAAFETHQGTTLSTVVGQLSRFAGDNDRDTITFSAVTNPTHGTLTLNATGTFSYVPAVGFSGTDSFTYRVADPIGYSQSATVSIDVTNERPTAYDLDFRTQHGQVYNGTGRGVLAGAADQDNDTLTAQLVTGAAHGTVVVNSDGTFTYTPTAGYAGNDQFVFRVNDGALTSYDAVVRLTVGNQAPVASEGYQSTQHDQPVEIALNAFDSDGDSLVYELLAAPQHGSLTYENLINNGSNGQPIRFTGKVTFHPTAGFVGDDSFQYRVNDGVTNSDPAEVSLSIRNFAPKAAASLQRTTPGQSITVTGTGLLATASDPDGDTLTLSIVTQPAHGTLTLDQANGVYTGGYTYTPNAGYAGPDSFSWRVSDGATVSDTVTVTIDIQNNAPTIADRSFMQRYREATVNGSGQRTYSMDLAAAGIAMDAEKNPLQYEIVTNGQHGTATLTAQGVLNWTSTANTYTGADTVTVRVSDGYAWSEHADITIVVDNTKPIAAGDFYSITHNATLSLDATKLLGNDFDFDGDTLHIVSITNGTNGTLTLSGDTWTFNPSGWVGTTELTYIVSDGLINSEPATIEIEVTNAPVWGIDRSFTVTENGSIEFEISIAAGSAFSPDGDSVTVGFDTLPVNGTVTNLGGNRFRYTPTAGTYSGGGSSQYGNSARGFIGRDSLVLHLSDGTTQSPPIEYSFNVIDSMSAAVLSYAIDDSIVAGSSPSMLISADPAPAWTPSDSAVLPNAQLKSYKTRPGQTIVDQLSLSPGETIAVWTGSTWLSVNSTTTVSVQNNGTIVVSPDGSFQITSPPVAGSGITQARIKITNGTLTTESLVECHYVNHAPVVSSLSVSGIVSTTTITPVGQDSSFASTITGTLADYVRDPDGDLVRFASSSDSQQVISDTSGTLRVNYDGSYEFSAASTSQSSAVLTYEFNVYDEFGATTGGTISITAGNAIGYPPPDPPPSDQTDAPDAGGISGSWYWSQIPVGPIVGLNDGGHPAVSIQLVGSGAGTYGFVSGIDLSGAYYSIYQGMEDAFLENGGEPTTFYYKVTNLIGSYDFGEIRVFRKVIQAGDSVSSDRATVNCGLGLMAVLFSGNSVHTTPVSTDLTFGVVSKFPSALVDLHWVGYISGILNMSSDGNIVSPIRVGGTAHIVSDYGSILQPVFAHKINFLHAYFGTYNAGFAETDINDAQMAGPWNATTSTLDVTLGTLVAGNQIGFVGWGINNPWGHQGGDYQTKLRWTAAISVGSGGIDVIYVRQDLASDISSGGKISAIRGMQDIGGTIVASGRIGYGHDDGNYLPASSPNFTGLVSTSGDITAVIFGSWIKNVTANQGDISAIIVAVHEIGVVEALAGDESSWIVSFGKIGRVTGFLGVAGLVSALTDIGQVWSGGDMSAMVQAGMSIRTVIAWANITGTIAAWSGTIEQVSAGSLGQPGHSASGGSILSQRIQAGRQIDKINARQSIDSSSVIIGGRIVVPGGITSSLAGINSIEASQDITANIKAAADTGSVLAGSFVNGHIESKYGSILTVSASSGRIEGDIKANKNIGTVTAWTDRLGNTISTTGSILSVIATQGQITGNTTAQNTLGTISAGTDITGNITATTGSIEKILAGTYAPGNLSGDISAHGDIVTIDVKGYLPVSELESIDFSAVDAAFDELRRAAQSQDVDAFANIVLPDLPVLPASIKGNISGSIVSGGSVYNVIADGKLSSDVTAERSLPNVWVYRTISGDLTATTGSVAVTTYDRLDGDVKAPRGITGFSYDDTAGELIANSGTISFEIWGSLLNDATARDAVSIRAYGDVDGETKVSQGFAEIVSMNNLSGGVYARDMVAGIGRRTSAGDLVSSSGSVLGASSRVSSSLVKAGELDNDNRTTGLLTRFAATDGTSPSNPPGVTVSSVVILTTEANLAAFTEAEDEISEYGAGELRGNKLARYDVTLFNAGNINSDRIVSLAGSVSLKAYQVKANIHTVYDGSERPQLGGYVSVIAIESFDGSIYAKRDVNVVALGRYSNIDNLFHESIIAASQIKGASVNIIGSGPVYTDKIFATKNVLITSYSNVDANDIFANGAVSISAHGDVESNITATSQLGGLAIQDVTVFTWGAYSGDIRAGGAVLVKTGGDFDGSTRSRYQTNVTSYGVVHAANDGIVAGDLTLGGSHVRQLGSLNGQIFVFGGGGVDEGTSSPLAVEGKLKSLNSGVSVVAYGSVDSDLSAPDTTRGVVAVIANPHGNSMSAESGFTGKVVAGKGTSVLVAGTIRDSEFTVSGNSTIGAGRDVLKTTVINENHLADISVGADFGVDEVLVIGGKDVRIRAIEGIKKSEVKDAKSVFVSSHGTASVKIQNSGDTVVSALQNVEAQVVDGRGNLILESASANILGQSTTNSQGEPGSALTAGVTGNVIFSALNDITYTANALGSVTITAGKTISGDFSGQTIRATAFNNINETSLTSKTGTFAYARSSISGRMKSHEGSVTVRSSGNLSTAALSSITAVVNAKLNARVTALGGSIGGSITTTDGSVSVLASKSVSATITSGSGVNIDAGLNIAGNVSADGAVNAFAVFDITGDVNSWEASVDAVAGLAVTGNVYAEKNAYVYAMVEDVSGYVYSSLGSSTVYAGGDVSGTVDAHNEVDVHAIRNITGNLTSTASSVHAVSIGGSVNAEISAMTDVDVFALVDSSKNVTATFNDVKINVYGGRTSGTVTAGRDIAISVGKQIASESVTAARSIDLWAGEDITVTAAMATHGDAIVSPWGKHTGKVEAPQGLVTLLVGGNSTGSYLNGKSVAATIWGTASAFHAVSTTTTSVAAFGNFTGLATGIDGVGVKAWGESNDVTIGSAAGGGSIWSLGNLKATIDVEKNSKITSFGTLNLDATSTGGSIYGWAFSDLTGFTDAKKYSTLVGWGNVNLQGEGDAGAFAWSYGTLGGSQTSDDGYAIAVSNFDNSATVDAKTLAVAVSLDNVNGAVTSDDMAMVIAGSNATSSVTTTNGSLAIIAFGNVQASANSGKHAVVIANGNVTGSVNAAQNIVAFAIGNLDASLIAEQDIVFAGAGNAITGSIVGYRDVWNVFSFGTVNAGIVALGLTEGGIVHKVQGVTSVAGTISASAAFEYGRTGGDWTATVSAPTTPTTPAPVIIDHDATMAAEFPVPSPVVLDKLAIRAVLAAVYGAHVVEKTGYEVLKSIKVNSMTSKRQDVLDEIADERSQQGNRADDMELDQYDAWLDEFQSFSTFLEARRDALELSEFRQMAELLNRNLSGIALRNEAIESRNNIRNTAIDESRQLLTQLRAAKLGSAQDRQAAIMEFAKRANTLAVNLALANAILTAMPLVPVQRSIVARIQRGDQAAKNAEEAGASRLGQVYQALGIMVWDWTGAMGLYHAIEGMDPVTLRQYSGEERFLEAMSGITQLLQLAVGGAQLLDQMKGPCGGYLTERCFVGETVVLTGENASWSYAENIGLQPTEDQRLSLAQLCWILGLGSAVVAFGAAKLSDDRRKKRGAWLSIENNDDLFAADPENRFLDEETPVPPHSVARIQVAEHDASLAVANEFQSGDNATMNRTDETAAPRSKPRAGFVTRGLGIMAAVLLAVGSLLSIRDAGGPPGPISVASAEIERSIITSPRYSSTPIREIQPIADRVLADNPETRGQAPSDFGEFHATSWRLVKMVVPKPDGEWMKVTLARPQAWIEAAQRDSEGRIWLEFKELGIANWANVLAIEPCPEAALGEGRLVTGKFEHSSAEVIDLFVDGVSEPIGTTSNHPFWSEDRRDFVQAGQLRIGERLRLRDGSTPVVTAAVARSQSVPVFNLEVDGEHVYYVASSGVLVHNSDNYFPKDGDPWTQDANGRWHDHEGRFTGERPQEWGFATDPEAVTLEEGTILSRLGKPDGDFAAPPDVPFEQRSLPGVEQAYEHHFYRVVQPLDGVMEGPASPAFGQPGGGIQWFLPDTIDELIRQGVIEEL